MGHDHRRNRVATFTGIALVACLLIAACSSDSTNKVTAAQTRVSKAEQGVKDAQTAFDKATAQFCGDAKDYIAALDRYGKAFDQSAATVGDIKTVGADLENPRATVVSSAEAVTPTRATTWRRPSRNSPTRKLPSRPRRRLQPARRCRPHPRRAPRRPHLSSRRRPSSG